jgi:hypothetical protein
VSAQQLFYGGVPVPYTVAWTAEERTFLAHCRSAGGTALCMDLARGVGRPRFGSPHAQRQREAIADGLCDLCGRSLAVRTKVSLSHARPSPKGFRIGDILQVEPLLHRECARECLRHCPSLKRDAARGSLMVRQVKRYAVQMAIMDEEYVETLTGERRKAIGHAKVQLLDWVDRDAAWLGSVDPCVVAPSVGAGAPAGRSDG